jgi:hypothetical protein
MQERIEKLKEIRKQIKFYFKEVIKVQTTYYNKYY